MIPRTLMLGALAMTLAAGTAFAQDTVKIGLILPMTGPFASTGRQIDGAAPAAITSTAPARPSHCLQNFMCGPPLAIGRNSVPTQKQAPRRSRASYSSGTISSATMLMILMSGFTAGPAVSL